MNRYQSHCGCNNVQLTLFLPNPIEVYPVRQCDCHFCDKQNIKYLSDPKGHLLVESKSKLKRLKQGSEQAEFLACSECKTVVAASTFLKEKSYAAVNASLICSQEQLDQAEVVSPKLLSAIEKLSRWQKVWSTFALSEETV